MGRFAAIGFTVAIAAILCACGTTGAENAALLTQPLRSTDARIKIVRASEFVAGLRGARVKLDGKEIADLGGGGSTVMDVAAGSHEVTVDVWDHPNVYKLRLDAKRGMLYTLEISARTEAAVAGQFGVVGMLAEASANENGGVFEIRVADVRPVRS